MGTHLYFNPGARDTKTRTSIGGTVGIPTTTDVELHDGADHVQFSFTDLDALNEFCELAVQARAEHVAALLESRSEWVVVDDLRPEDLAVIDGELVMVDTTVIDGPYLIVRYGKKYQGLYDLSGDRSIRLTRSTKVKRLLADVSLAVVR